jgi:cell division septum initiation protein DivIVA
MEILDLLEEFESIIEGSGRIPMTGKVVIHEEILYNYLDKFRAYLPQSIRDAEYLLREKERILAEATREGEGIIENARLKSQRITGESEIVKQAIVQGEKIIENAKLEARGLITGAYGYSEDVMSSLQKELEEALKIIRTGREAIRVNLPPVSVRELQDKKQVSTEE